MKYFDEVFNYRGVRCTLYQKYIDETDLTYIGYSGFDLYDDIDFNTIVTEWGEGWTVEIKDVPYLDYTQYGPFNKESECVICYENIYNMTDYSCTRSHRYISRCNHIFHFDCILKWSDIAEEDTNISCPMCREIITFKIK